MNAYLASRMPSFFVANLRNSRLLRAIFASNLNILNQNPLRPDLFRGSLTLLKQPLFVAFPITVLDVGAFVVLFFALAKADLQFGAATFPSTWRWVPE